MNGKTIFPSDKIHAKEFPCGTNSICCAFSTRHDGNVSFSHGDSANALANRKNFLRPLNIDYGELVCSRQIHGPGVHYAKTEDIGRGALSNANAIQKTDAFVTDIKRLPIAVFTADCLSIFIVDPETPAIGMVHAGWRSTSEKILSKTIDAMQKLFKTNPMNLQIAFGPAIRSCCYQVSPEFFSIFDCGLTQKNGRWYMDLIETNKKELSELKIKNENIFDSEICTSCHNDEFFSYRKEGALCGRIMSVMMLR